MDHLAVTCPSGQKDFCLEFQFCQTWSSHSGNLGKQALRWSQGLFRLSVRSFNKTDTVFLPKQNAGIAQQMMGGPTASGSELGAMAGGTDRGAMMQGMDLGARMQGMDLENMPEGMTI